MPSPGSYTDIFGGNNISPSQPSYLTLNPLTASVSLGWPIEQAPAGSTVVADIIDVNATAGGLTISLSDATQVSTGYTALFNNIGANSFNVLNKGGGVIATVASGTVWQLYLADNTTTNGTWRAFQFGVGTSSATAAALAGSGLVAITTTLNENMVTSVKSANYVAVNADRATCLEWTGGAGTLTLPNSSSVAAGWFVIIKNLGTGVWTTSVTGGNTIDGVATLALNPFQSCFLIFDGTNYFTVGLNSAGFLGFANGTAASPSIFFQPSPGTGLYSPLTNQFGIATAGVDRLLIDQFGHFSMEAPSDTNPTLTVFGPSTGAGITSVFENTLATGGSTTNPILQLLNTNGAGAATLSLCGENAVPGTSDFSISHAGSAVLKNFANNSTITLATVGATSSISITPNGNNVLTLSPAGSACVQMGSAFANSISIVNLTQTTATGGAATLPANPVGFLTVLINGAASHIPYYS